MVFENENWKLEIEACEGCNPREDDNLAKMVCFHNRYLLGDKHDYRSGNYDSWNELKKAIIRNEDVACILPIYMYDHSGITVSTRPFGCQWDSGQVGFVFITKKAIRENYGIKNVTKKYVAKAEQHIGWEMETYDQYVRGDVYSFDVTNKETGEEDSCSGFYGNDFWNNGIEDNIENECIKSLYLELKAEYGACERFEKELKFTNN
jgi:hypothetical protein